MSNGKLVSSARDTNIYYSFLLCVNNSWRFHFSFNDLSTQNLQKHFTVLLIISESLSAMPGQSRSCGRFKISEFNMKRSLFQLKLTVFEGDYAKAFLQFIRCLAPIMVYV